MQHFEVICYGVVVILYFTFSWQSLLDPGGREAGKEGENLPTLHAVLSLSPVMFKVHEMANSDSTMRVTLNDRR